MDASTDRIKILAVDDHVENLIALQAALDDPSYELICVASGWEALSLITEHEFAAILLDVQMPGIDGFETARQLRKHPSSSSTPIIFLTAIYRDDAYAEQGYVAGAVDYIFKPLNVDILRAKVAVFCDLYRKTKEIQRQAEMLRLSSLKEQENTFLKEAIRARDEFLSMASHELKTPMTPLSLNVQAVTEMFESDRVNEVPKEKLLRMMKTATNQVARLSRLVNDLLDVSRIVEGKLVIDREEVDLCALVRNVIESFEEEIKKLGYEIKLSVDPRVAGLWDRSRVEQVVINLLSNALKYGREKPIEIEVRAKDGHAYLYVRDQGLGIAKEDQARIFERFERAVSSRHYGGLGLGLYITRQIVELQGGKIEIESESGKGSCFTVRLPQQSIY